MTMIVSKGFMFRMMLCVVVGVAGLFCGRYCLSRVIVRQSVASRTKAIARAKPWISDVARQARGRLTVFVFKKERFVEVHAPGWAKPRLYEMTGFSGRLGPKLREGDGQIPEGIYGIEYLNPNSIFHRLFIRRTKTLVPML